MTALFVAVACLVGCEGRSTGASTDSVNAVGVKTFSATGRSPVPAIVGTTLDGQTIALQSFGRGDIVFINVWASWCGPCRAESPMLAKAAKSLEGDDVRFVGLDEEDTASAARSFVSSVGAAYPELVDTDGSLLRKLKLLPQMGIPSTLVLDRNGKMAARVVGAATLAQVEQIVKTLRSES